MFAFFANGILNDKIVIIIVIKLVTFLNSRCVYCSAVKIAMRGVTYTSKILQYYAIIISPITQRFGCLKREGDYQSAKMTYGIPSFIAIF